MSDTQVIRQLLLDLLTEYQELEKPANPELLKLHIEAYEDRFEALIQEQIIAELEKLKSQNVAIPCEPDCTPIRHARHEGAWEQHLEFDDFIDERIKKLKGDK